MGENEKPAMTAGHGGSVSGRLIQAQMLMVTAAMATVMMMLILFMEDGLPRSGHGTVRRGNQFSWIVVKSRMAIYCDFLDSAGALFIHDITRTDSPRFKRRGEAC